MRLAHRLLSLLRFGHEESRGPFAGVHQRFIVLHEHRAEGGRLQLADLQIVFQGQTDRISSICFCVSGFGCSCAPRERFGLCGLASGVPDACVKAQFCISLFQLEFGSQMLKQRGD